MTEKVPTGTLTIPMMEAIFAVLGSWPQNVPDVALIVEERDDGAARCTATERQGLGMSLRERWQAMPEQLITDATGPAPRPGLFPIVLVSHGLPRPRRLEVLWTCREELQTKMAAWNNQSGGGDA